MAHSTKPQNLIGERFGRLVVLKRLSNKNDKRNWLCRCDCGKEHRAPGYSLKRGTTQSCGCLRVETHSLPGDQGSFNTFYGIYVLNAKKAGRVFDLSKKEFREITSLPCAYCGSLPEPFYSKNRIILSVVPYLCNGIDRVDNSLGYVKENCLSCCHLCNFMKRDLSVEKFKKHVEKIASYRV